MKKILITACAVAMATAVHAAAVTWSMTTITDSTGAVPSAGGWVGYFMDSATYSTFTALDTASVAAYVTGNNLYSATTTKAARGGAVSISAASGNYAANDTISGYIVLFDAADAASAEHYAYTAVQSTTINAAGSPGAIAFGTFASATSTTGGWTAVPEPTSGLLMLLGMAGLALRRRRA